MSVLEFGMKYRNSTSRLLRLAANLCIAWEKKKTDWEEKKLKKQNVKDIDERAAKEVLEKIQRGQK